MVSAPGAGGRCDLLPMLDMSTDVFASPGWRTTGTEARSWALVPPGWTGTLPDGVDRIDAPTAYVWIIGRTKTGPRRLRRRPPDPGGLPAHGAGALGQAGRTGDRQRGCLGRHEAPKVQVDTMRGDKYFPYAAEVMKLQRPHRTDQPIVARRIGIEPGKPFDAAEADPALRQALQTAPEEAQRLMASKVRSLAPAT